MNSKRKCKRRICRALIVVMMAGLMGGVYPMMRENQACAFTRTMNVNDWLEQCRMVAFEYGERLFKGFDFVAHTGTGCADADGVSGTEKSRINHFIFSPVRSGMRPAIRWRRECRR